MKDEILRKIIIPPNTNRRKRVAHYFKWRNFIEAIIWFALITLVIFNTSFLLKVKIVLIACIAGSVAIFNLAGIKNQSVSQFIINYIIFKRSKTEYHLRSVKDESSKNIISKLTAISRTQAEDGNSVAKQLYNKYKRSRQLKNGYSEKSTGKSENEQAIKPNREESVFQKLISKHKEKHHK